MTLEDQSSDASDILEQALAAHETERLAVRAGFVPTVLDAVPVASSRSWLSANSALIIGAALFLTVSTAVAAIVRYVRQEESVAARVCVECDESQYMNSSRDRHGQPDSILQRNPGNAQVQGSGTVRVTENFRVAGDNYKFFDLRVSSRGRIAVRQGDEQPFMIYSPSNSDVVVFDYASMPELGRLTLNWGWVGGGDSLWVQSVTGVHVIALTPRPRIVSSRAVPAETPGPPGTTPRARNPYPGVDAMYRNGDLLISQAFPEDEARNALGRYDLAGVPTTFRVRTDKDHNVVSFSPGRPVGWEKACERHSASPGLLGPVFFTIPLCDATSHSLFPDGERAVYISGDAPVENPANFRIAQVRLNGDTIYSREYSIPTIPVTASDRDSILAYYSERASRSDPALVPFRDSILRTEMPTYRTPFSNIIVGNDGTVLLWLLRFTESPRYLLISPSGDPIGTFTLPSDVLVTEVSRTALFGLQRRPDTPSCQPWYHFVRYAIGR